MTRRRLLAAARREFTGRGYEGASLRRIAQGAGVTLPTVYHHFGSKADLFRAAYRAADATLLAALENALRDADGFSDRLSAMVGAARALHRADPSVPGILAVGQIERGRSADLAGAAGPTGDSVPALLRRVVDDAEADGALAAGVDPGAAVEVLAATTLGIALYSSVLGPEDAEGMFGAWAALLTGRFVV